MNYILIILIMLIMLIMLILSILLFFNLHKTINTCILSYDDLDENVGDDYDNRKTIKWNLSINDKIILYSNNYKYLIELTPQIEPKEGLRASPTAIYFKNRNNNHDLRITDYKCVILRSKKDNFIENNYLVVKGDRYNIISYKGLPKVFKYEKKEDNPYYIDMDYDSYGKPKIKIDKKIEIEITEDIINKFITKKVYEYIPNYMVLY